MVDTLIHGDAFAVLPSLPQETFNTIYIDPPFGTGRNHKLKKNVFKDPIRDPVEFVRWLSPLLKESFRLLAETGSLFVHLDHHCAHYVKVELDKIFGIKNFINEIVWCYSIGGKSTRRFARKHDTILWYGKTNHYQFFPDAIRVPRKAGSHMRVVTLPSGQQVQEKTNRKTGKVYRYPIKNGKIPEDWWSDIEVLNRSAKERTGWPTQKPRKLLRRIIAATTQPGDHVGDWFCGSGTTAQVAKELGCTFVTCDSNPDAISIAKQRLGSLSGDLRYIDTVTGSNAGQLPGNQGELDSRHVRV